jgi:hypothetical protein
MNESSQNPIANHSSPSGASGTVSARGTVEDTLRLIAGLSAPAGIEDRIMDRVKDRVQNRVQDRVKNRVKNRIHADLLASQQTGLSVDAYPAPRRGRILSWPAALRPDKGWMRSAAAAAIVFVVAGGGWGVYSRVQTGQPARSIVLPPHAASGGFSNAGAMRTPQTLSGPVLAHPVTTQQAQVCARIAQKPIHRGLSAAVNKAGEQSVAPLAK